MGNFHRAFQWLLGLMLCIGLSSLSVAAEESTTDSMAEILSVKQTSLKKLVKKYRDLERKYATEINKAKRSSRTRDEFNKKVAEIRKNYPDPKDLIGDIHDLVKKKAKSKSSREALTLLALQPVDKKAKSFAEKSLFKYHYKGDALLDYASTIASKTGVESLALLKKVLKTKASKKVKSVAAYGIANNQIATFKGDKSTEKDIVKKLKASIKYAGNAKIGNTPLKKLADNKLFGFTKLRVGAVAEDIIGEDLDGKKFKLSDYRGKVVFLDFWGDW